MQTYQFFIGIDVSKDTLDLTLRDRSQVLDYQKIAHQSASIEQCLEQWQRQYGFGIAQCLICLENTGRYMNLLLRTVCLQKMPVWVANAMTIKRSMGLQRGKNDKVDAHRIAEYAYRHHDQAVLYQPADERLEKLKVLQASRQQLLNTQKRLTTDLKESQYCDPAGLYLLKEKHYQPVLKALDKQIQTLDEQMDKVIADDETLSRLKRIVCSVPGVGKVSAIALIVATQGFSKFSSAKKLACYCGLVPFEYRSGSSIRGKTKLSHFAHKGLKSLLHMCAMAAIRQQGELQAFYQRKLAQGKAKMSALNAIKNKIIQRIMALVRDGRTYENNYAFVLA